MKSAVIYARVSSKAQEEEGFSIPAQLELLRKYAKREGFRVLHEYAEAETAKAAGRHQFSEMVASVQAMKEPVTILVEKTDRLYRNFKDFLMVDDLINDKGAEVHIVKEGEIIGKSANSHTKFIHGIKVLLAKNYIDNLSEEVKKGKRQKVMQGGWHTRAPFGYRNDRNTREIIIDPDKAPFVIHAFQLYASGLYSLDATREKLLADGFIYQPYQPKINRSRLHEMLQNPAYIGKIPFDGDIYDGKHAPLIDLETWLKARSALKKDNKPNSCMRRDFLYRGVLKCAECGNVLVGELKKGKYVYYRCISMKNGCTQGYVPESVLDEEYSAMLASLRFPPDAKGEIRQAVREMQDSLNNTANEAADRINAQKKKVRQKRRMAYEDKQAGHLDHDLWLEIDQGYQEELQALEIQESKIDHADTDYFQMVDAWIELPDIITTGWVMSDHEEKKILVNIVTSNCYVKDRKAHLELKEVLSLLRKLPEKRGSRK